jgi:hypothetical protein
VDRRRAIRRSVSSDEPLAHARLRTGGQLRVLDASSWGALAETRERLLPGRHLDVHIVATTGRVLVRARVTRAHVCRLTADTIDYRAALAFDFAVDVQAAGYAIPPVSIPGERVEGTPYPDMPVTSEIEFA